ncbi:OmpH family outer membrane protein [[Haemophilus] ducreyi]|uniref:OmpH family outer membrane protein n=1 Tax=Haemophilus ducreyi TaxID=730 RepID=UPI0006564015|nr:OmpH family outer membrane protein [[Haemophilus] ducreyi]AKO45467.1 membrane protein [[Haemophilus] ducreyi]AKO46854.1 membrane protein [[Haemophilus] ducreyi]AKO48193.1 membrane protein [[Haemophilus] ducreyi]AKO49584.1 membrane protein [[Haemophilus] ducreyi]ANF62496.1 hypothetical protein A6037_07175 [[Haemophilus] ducreyi]
MKKMFKIATISSALATVGLAQANDNIAFVDPNFLVQNHPVALNEVQKFDKFIKNGQNKYAEEDKKLAEENKALTTEKNKLESDAKKLQSEQANVEASLKKKSAALEKDAPRLRSKEIQTRQAAIESEYKAFQKKVISLQKREEEFGKKVEAFQKRAENFQESLIKAQEEAGGLKPDDLQKLVVSEINSTIKEVATSKGYTLVLPPSVALYAADENKDITESVLNALKAKHPEIKIEQPTETKSDESKSEKTMKSEEVKK